MRPTELKMTGLYRDLLTITTRNQYSFGWEARVLIYIIKVLNKHVLISSSKKRGEVCSRVYETSAEELIQTFYI